MNIEEIPDHSTNAPITSTTAMPSEPSEDIQHNNIFFVSTITLTHQSPMTYLLCCRFYSLGSLQDKSYKLPNKHSSSRLWSKRQHFLMFDTSATNKKIHTRIIFFFLKLCVFRANSIIVWNFVHVNS